MLMPKLTDVAPGAAADAAAYSAWADTAAVFDLRLMQIMFMLTLCG